MAVKEAGPGHYQIRTVEDGSLGNEGKSRGTRTRRAKWSRWFVQVWRHMVGGVSALPLVKPRPNYEQIQESSFEIQTHEQAGLGGSILTGMYVRKRRKTLATS